MRRLCIIILLLISALRAEAQTLWTELKPEVQTATIRSRRTPDVVREVMLSSQPLKLLDAQTRASLLQKVTSRSGDENLAALYLYIYSALREPNGSMARSDVRMLSLHGDMVFKSWAQDSDCDELYNWAYALGSYSATGGEARVKRVLKKLSSTKMKAFYGWSLVHTFNSAHDIARASVLAGLSSFNDITPPATLHDTFTPESEETYSAVNTITTPVVAPMSGAPSDIEIAMRKECMAWSGAYHTALKHNLGRGISLIYSERADGEYLTIADSHGDSYTFSNEMFMLDNGYFVAVKRGMQVHGIIVGKLLQRGGFVLFGERNLDYGTKILDVKCGGRSVHLHIDAQGKGEGYLNYTIR